MKINTNQKKIQRTLVSGCWNKIHFFIFTKQINVANIDFSESKLDEDTITEDHGRNISFKCEICETCFKLKIPKKTRYRS